jgi:predicted MFS family arabinose efflux permease
MSEVVSLLGDWMSFVAVSLLALRGGGGVVGLALVLVGHSLPHALLAPVAGTLADRLDRKRLMIGANLAEAALTVGMTIAAARRNVAAVQFLVFARASVAAFLPPVHSAVLRRVVRENELLAANAVSSLTWSVMFAVGMAAGGFIAALGPTIALAIDASSFVVAALLLRALPSIRAEGRSDSAAKAGILTAIGSVRRDMAKAVRYAWSRSAMLEAVLAKTPLAIAGGGAWVLLNLASNEIALAGSGAITLGILQCMRGTGTGVGPLFSSALIRRGSSMALAFALSALTCFGGIALLALGYRFGIAAALLAVLAWGAGVGSNWVLSSAEIQRLSPDRYLGRLSAIDGLLHTASMCGGALAGAVLVERTGAPAASAWLGLAVSIPLWACLQWALRRHASRTSVPPESEAPALAPENR